VSIAIAPRTNIFSNATSLNVCQAVATNLARKQRVFNPPLERFIKRDEREHLLNCHNNFGEDRVLRLPPCANLFKRGESEACQAAAANWRGAISSIVPARTLFETRRA